MSDERLVSDEYTPWTGEHVHRYNVVKEYINLTDVVLDIACGTGYGTNQLLNYTNGKVTGGDISAEAIEGCKKRWADKANLDFLVMDGTSLSFPDSYFDKIISFETIEHTAQYKEMLLEFNRVLKPSGLLILSTPNQRITSPDGNIKNPYHVQEFSIEDLSGILHSIYHQVEIYGQRNKRFDKKGFATSWRKFIIGIFNIMGIRKLPYSFKNKIVRVFGRIDLYPQAGDFILENGKDIINLQCPVLFVVCKK
jgi:ubiquinone/menaquinone biosynthesis C-methylase UbiE